MGQREIIRDNVRELYKLKFGADTPFNRRKLEQEAAKSGIKISNALLQRIEECSSDVRTSSLAAIAKFFKAPVAALTEEHAAQYLSSPPRPDTAEINKFDKVAEDLIQKQYASETKVAARYLTELAIQRLGKEQYPKVLSTVIPGPNRYFTKEVKMNGVIKMRTPVGSAALRIQGNSMHPAIRDGWCVIFGGEATAQPGEYVLITHKDGRRIIKELLFERADSYVCQQVNGEARLTVMKDDVERIDSVTAVVPPSMVKEF